ncbi:hypothetical protein V5O48_011118 [Marasmius crinis-equi]|uniref:F-box domain-containing protein n=1 Tax=Marasmius crinis-equi TaxID=585013 RepID=A0ABR3F6Y1_9AGAR
MTQPAVLCERCRCELTSVSSVNNLPAVDPRLTNSNYVLTEAELWQSQMLLLQDLEIDAGLEREMMGLQWAMDDLRMRKLALAERIKQHRLIISAHRRFPLEVWQEIFLFACHSSMVDNGDNYDGSEDVGYSLTLDDTYLDHNRQAKTMPTITLSQVFSRWKDIVHSSPALWSSIKVDLSSLPPFAEVPLGLYLEKSKPHPLRIRVQAPHGFKSTDDPEPIQEIWDTLSCNFHRCEGLSCDILEYGFGIPPISFPKLTTLEDDSRSIKDARINTFRDAPRLTSVVTFCLYPPPYLPYAQLTSLECRSLYHREVEVLVLNILPSCRKLQTLIMGFGPDALLLRSTTPLRNEHSQPPTFPVNIPSLRIIRTDHRRAEGDYVHTSLLENIFASLATPSLERLVLQCAESRENSWAPSFFYFLTQASPSLQYLTLTLDIRSETKPPPMSDLLGALPNLVELVLTLDPGTWLKNPEMTLMISWKRSYENVARDAVLEVFRSLQESNNWSQWVFVPKLRNISIAVGCVSWGDDIIVDSVLRAAEARSLNRGTGLKKVRLMSFSAEDYYSREDIRLKPDAVARIEQLSQDAGVEVTIGGWKKAGVTLFNSFGVN